MPLAVRLMEPGDPGRLNRTLGRAVPTYEEDLAAHLEGRIVFLVGSVNEQVVGHGSVVWESKYSPFREAKIPEIHDLNVAEQFRRRGLGSLIMKEAEEIVSQRRWSWSLLVRAIPGGNGGNRSR